MAIAIFGLGAALIAAGGYLIFLSVDLVPTEMGLFYALSGVILIAAAAIVAAVAALIYRLDRIAAPRRPKAAAAAPEAAAAPPSTEGAAEAEPAAEPEVIARYNAGGAKYALFANGVIEAETPEGGLRFASMEEFKAYVGGRRALKLQTPPAAASALSDVSGRAPMCWMTSLAASAARAAQSKGARAAREAGEIAGGEQIARAGGVDEPGDLDAPAPPCAFRPRR